MEPERAPRQPCAMTRGSGCQGAGRRAEGAGRRLPAGAGRRRGGAGRRAGGRGGAPGVLWDAAVEWRWARDFEQTRVCVSEAPPPPRLLGAPGARREKEAAAPPARVSVSSGEPGLSGGDRRRARGEVARAGSAGRPAPGAAGPVGRGGRRVVGARPRAAWRRRARLSLGGVGAARSALGRKGPAAVDRLSARPGKQPPAPGFWEPVLLLCHFVPAPPFAAARRRRVLPTPLCMDSSGCVSVSLAKPTSQMS